MNGILTKAGGAKGLGLRRVASLLKNRRWKIDRDPRFCILVSLAAARVPLQQSRGDQHFDKLSVPSEVEGPVAPTTLCPLRLVRSQTTYDADPRIPTIESSFY